MALVLIKNLGRNKKGNSYMALYKCSYCEETVKRRKRYNNAYKSCGCAHGQLIREARTTHGDADWRNKKETRLYRTWICMQERCRNPNKNSYKFYGGRGITVCNEWLDYQSFKKWALSSDYQDHLTIDRIDNEKGYSPENCQWLTRSENSKKQHRDKRLKESVDL